MSLLDYSQKWVIQKWHLYFVSELKIWHFMYTVAKFNNIHSSPFLPSWLVEITRKHVNFFSNDESILLLTFQLFVFLSHKIFLTGISFPGRFFSSIRFDFCFIDLNDDFVHWFDVINHFGNVWLHKQTIFADVALYGTKSNRRISNKLDSINEIFAKIIEKDSPST